jgi:hypothetical protein
MRSLTLGLTLASLILTAGCAGLSPREQRMLSGGAIGAAGGALIGALSGGSPAAGAVIGGAGGALIGGVTR